MANMELKEFKINYNNNELFYKINPQDEKINKIIITFNQDIYKQNKTGLLSFW